MILNLLPLKQWNYLEALKVRQLEALNGRQLKLKMVKMYLIYKLLR